MTRKLLFVTEWAPKGYEKLVTYLKYILNQYGVPFEEIKKVADIEPYIEHEKITLGLVIHSFDMIAAHGFPTFKNIKYVGLYLEPISNVDHYLRTYQNQAENIYGSIVPFMSQHQYFRERWPNKPLFSFYQGYVPYEDVTPVEDKTIDVLAPGFCRLHVPNRNRIIEELRKRGLKVVDDYLFGDDLNRAMENAKVTIYYPLMDYINSFHGQRTLWALNKHTCAVALPSADTQCEEFYKDVYYQIRDPDISKFCDAITKLVQSGQWKPLGDKYYETYKNKLDGVRIFDKCLLKFFRDFTCPFFDDVNPIDDKYSISITKLTNPIQLQLSSESGFRDQLIQKYKTKYPECFVSTCTSIRQCYYFILRILQKKQGKWPGFRPTRDRILTTHQPIPDLKYEFLAHANGSLNISIMDIEYKLKTQTKLIFIKSDFGILVDANNLIPYLESHEKKFGFRPVVVDESGGLYDKSIRIFQPNESPEHGGLIVWPTEKQGAKDFDPIPEIFAKEAETRNMQQIDQIQIANYKRLQNDVDLIIRSFLPTYTKIFPFQLCLLSEYVSSSKFPILLVDKTETAITKKFVDHLRSYNIASEQTEFGLMIPCGHWIKNEEFEYMLDVIEEFFEIM